MFATIAVQLTTTFCCAQTLLKRCPWSYLIIIGLTYMYITSIWNLQAVGFGISRQPDLWLREVWECFVNFLFRILVLEHLVGVVFDALPIKSRHFCLFMGLIYENVKLL